MKKRVSRERRMPAFKLDLASLEALIAKLSSQFGEGLRVNVSIEHNNTQYDFSSVEEVRTCVDLPSEVVDFRLLISDSSYVRDCTVRSGGFMGAVPKVIVQSDSEAWCAGVVEIAVTFVSANRLWYSPIMGWPISIVAVILPSFAMALSSESGFLKSHPYAWLPLVLIWLISAAIYFVPSRTLPSAVLQVRSIESTLRKFMPEFTLLVAVIAVIVSVIGLFSK